MRHRQYGLTALCASLGLIASVGTAHAQSYFDYFTTYTTTFNGTTTTVSSLSSPPDNGTTLPGPPTDTVNSPYFTISPLKNLTGGGSPTSIGLLSMQSNFAQNIANSAPVVVNQSFTLSFTLYKSDASGNRTGQNATYNYSASFMGMLSNNSNTVKVFPNPAASPTNFTLASGTTKYDVSIDSFSPAGFPGQTPNPQGVLTADVFAESEIDLTPEPGASALLLGAAVPGSFLFLRHRRKRK